MIDESNVPTGITADGHEYYNLNDPAAPWNQTPPEQTLGRQLMNALHLHGSITTITITAEEPDLMSVTVAQQAWLTSDMPAGRRLVELLMQYRLVPLDVEPIEP